MTSGLEEKLRVAICEYDFAVEGGAVGDITIRGSSVPDGAVVVGGFLEVETAVTSGGAATVALKLEGVADILAATAKATLSAGALLALVPDFATAGDWVKMTANRNLIATVATAALTAGKLKVALFYVRLFD